MAKIPKESKVDFLTNRGLTQKQIDTAFKIVEENKQKKLSKKVGEEKKS